MQGNLPPEAQEKLEQLQNLQDTAQQVVIQKNQAESKLEESRNALKALEEVDDETTMYRSVGELMIETDYETAVDELEDTIDSLEIRAETLKKQEDRVESQFEKLQKELQEMLGAAGGGGVGGASIGGPGPGAGGA